MEVASSPSVRTAPGSALPCAAGASSAACSQGQEGHAPHLSVRHDDGGALGVKLRPAGAPHL